MTGHTGKRIHEVSSTVHERAAARVLDNSSVAPAAEHLWTSGHTHELAAQPDPGKSKASTSRQTKKLETSSLAHTTRAAGRPLRNTSRTI